MIHDPTYKAAFGHRRMVRDFLRLLIAYAPDPHGVLGALRLDTLERLPAEYVGDMVWRVQVQPWGDEPGPRWLHLLLLLESQSDPDWMMAAQVMSYATQLYLDLDLDLHRRRGERYGDHHPLPPLLPIVLYNGEGEWEAPVRYHDIRRPRAERSPSAADAEASPAGVLYPDLVYMGEGFVLIDIRTLDREALPEGNAAAVLSFIEQVAAPTDLEEALVRLFETLPEAEDRSLAEVLSGWLRAVVTRTGAMETEEFDEMMQRTSTGRLRGTPEERLRAWFEGARAEGRAEGAALFLARERALLRRQATLRFGAGTGDQLAALLAEVADHDRLAEVGEWIVQCEDGTALLARTGASLSGS